MAEKTTKKTQPAQEKKNITPVAMMVAGALALGVGIGMMIQSQSQMKSQIQGQNSTSGSSNAGLESQMAAFITQNPKLILDSVRDYTTALQQQERAQAFNLVRANDGKTILGNPDGDVTIYEFSDYNCGYCKRSFNTLMQLVQADGNIRIVIKEYPILAQTSVDAAKLAFGAGEIGKFDAFHSAMMRWQGGLDENAFAAIAEQAGTTLDELIAAQSNIDTDAMINTNREMASQLNITGTPAFLIGDTLVPGAVSAEELETLVKAARENNNG